MKTMHDHQEDKKKEKEKKKKKKGLCFKVLRINLRTHCLLH